MQDVQIRTEIVINRCHGGFGLSREASFLLAARKGLALREEDGFLLVGDGHDQIEDTVPRNDPDLIFVVRELGDDASGPSARLRVVEVVTTIEIGSRDGYERVSVSGHAP